MSKPVLSIAVMHHSSRTEGVKRVVEACRGLPVQVVADPEPDGPHNPLRTARVAWQAIPPWATHHMVLQDDVQPVAGFASAVQSAVEACSDAIVGLYANALTANASQARFALSRGDRWAPLAVGEYVPTPGVVMPAETVRGFLGYLRGVPAHQDGDDSTLGRFSQEHGVRGYQTVPNLIEHEDGISLSGCSIQGPRRSVCFLPGGVAEAPGAAPDGLPPRAVVQFREGRTTIELPTDHWTTAEPHRIAYTWAKAAIVLGVHPYQVTAIFRASRAAQRRLPALQEGLFRSAAEELVAACYLTGLLGASRRPPPTAAPRPLAPRTPPHHTDGRHWRTAAIRTMVRRWTVSGFPRILEDAVGEPEVDCCEHLGTAAFHAGERAAARYRTNRRGVTEPPARRGEC